MIPDAESDHPARNAACGVQRADHRSGPVGSIASVAGRPAGMAGPFVGRARELAAVAKLIADDERTGVVLVGGEAGLGKTRLVDEVLAAHPGMDVVRGGAVPRTTPVSFELVRTAAQPVVHGWSALPERLEPLAEAAHAVLSDLQPPADRPIPVAEQIRAAAEVLRFLHTDRTIFVFEDVHWADPESLESVDRLMAAGPLHASVVVTYRPEALRRGHPVNTFLERAERRAHALQLRLEPLRREEVGEYLAATDPAVAEETVDRVHARTGGNPLFLSELVAAAADDGDLVDTLPWTLAEILRPEIERLPGEVRAVAEAVSVLGADAEFDLVAAAVAADEDTLLARLRHLVGAGILVESGPDRFDFRHELVREAVADGLFTRERRRIHAAAHDALLAARSEDEQALITHANGAGRTEDAADAGRRAALRALAQGSSHQAFGLADQALLVRADDVELLRTAVAAGWMTERYAAALDHLDRWDELVADDTAARAEILHWRVRLLWEHGARAAAETAAGELAGLCEELDDGEVRAQALADLAQHRMLSGQPIEAIAAADRALDLADPDGAVALQARAERASAQLFASDTRSEGIAELTVIVDDAEAAGEWVVASRALNNLPILAVADPRRHLERMRTAAQRSGLTCIATDGYRFALLELAEADGDRAEYAARLETVLSEVESDPLALTLAARLALGDGRLDDARHYADRLATAGDPGWFSAPLQAGLDAMIEMARTGDTGPMRAWLETEPFHHVKARLLLDGASAMIAAGLGPQLLAALASVEATRGVDPAADGLIAELGGDLEGAEARYRQVVESTERLPAVVLAEVHLGRARVAEARGDDPAPHLAAAADRLCRWPGRLRDRVEAMSGAPVPDQDDPRRLTPREREVALLVTEGLTNGGIAEELYISTKTASVHVSNILAKLGMSSRTEIAAWVAAGGLHDSG